MTTSLVSEPENAHTSLQCSSTYTVSIGTMSVTTLIATTASHDSVTYVVQALSSMSLYTATTTATPVSYIYSSRPPLLISTSSSNATSQSLPTLHYQYLYESLLTSTISRRDTHEPGVSLLATLTIYKTTHGTQLFAANHLARLLCRHSQETL